MLTVVDGVDESVFEFVVTAEKFWFDEVNHGKVLIEVVLEGCLTAGSVTVQSAVAAVVREGVPHQVVEEPDVGEAVASEVVLVRVVIKTLFCNPALKLGIMPRLLYKSSTTMMVQMKFLLSCQSSCALSLLTYSLA